LNIPLQSNVITLIVAAKTYKREISMEILMLGIWGMCGWACYSIAESKKRNKEVWAVLGVLFGFIAVIIISVLPTIG